MTNKEKAERLRYAHDQLLKVYGAYDGGVAFSIWQTIISTTAKKLESDFEDLNKDVKKGIRTDQQAALIKDNADIFVQCMSVLAKSLQMAVGEIKD